MKTIAIDINDVLRANTKQFIKVYTKFIDNNFSKTYEEIDDYNFINIFPFYDEDGRIDEKKYNQFKYEDYSYELYGTAPITDRRLLGEFNLWTQNNLRNFDSDEVPEVFLFSPFEINLSIPSTLSFLSRLGVRVRKIVFPINSLSVWEDCDIMITANPNLIENVPEGKTVLKIKTPYNTETKTEYEFDGLIDIIHDESKIIEKIIENKLDNKETNNDQ